MTTDWTVRFANQYYQLQPLHKAAVGKGTVRVRRYLNGELHFCYRDRELAYLLLPERPKPKTVNKVKNKNRRDAHDREQYIPPAHHAWRSFQFGKGPPWAR